jgi:hypothetical protein
MFVPPHPGMAYFPSPLATTPWRLPDEPLAGHRTPADQQAALLRQLIATLMVGQMAGCTDDVATVLTLLQRLLGDERPLRLGLALAEAIGGRPDAARSLLAEELDGWPAPDTCRAWLAMALRLGGDSAWRDVCHRLLAVSDDPAARTKARQLLDQTRFLPT